MRSTNLPLFDLFQRQRRYVVPLFQRPYVWEQEEQWEPLWQDIAGRAEAVLERDSRGSRSDKIGSHFLGAIVLNQSKVYGRQVDTVEVIDGQLAWDEKSRSAMTWRSIGSTRKLRPEPELPSKARMHHTSRVQRGWPLSQGGIQETTSRSPNSCERP